VVAELDFPENMRFVQMGTEMSLTVPPACAYKQSQMVLKCQCLSKPCCARAVTPRKVVFEVPKFGRIVLVQSRSSVFNDMGQA